MIFAAIPESALIERVHSHPGLQARAPPRARPGGHSPVRNCDSRRIPKSEAVLRPFVRHPRLRRGGTAAGRAGPRPEAFDGRLAHRTRRAGRLRLGWPCGLRGGGAVARALCRAAELQLPQHPRHRPRNAHRLWYQHDYHSECGRRGLAGDRRGTAACCRGSGRRLGRWTKRASSAAQRPSTTPTSSTW